MTTEEINYEVLVGVPEEHRATAAQLYDQAFGQKLALAIPTAAKRIALFEQHFHLDFALAAVGGSRLLGIAGFSTINGSLTGGISYQSLLSELGALGGNRAAIVLALYDRKAQSNELLMDGIAVHSASRGLGVGSRLLSKLIEYAEHEKYASIRLDVIDTNPAAKRLYERMGFASTKTDEFEFLRGVLGFGASTTMNYDLTDVG